MNRPTFFFTAALLAAPAFAQKSITVKEGTNMAVTASPDRATIVLDLQGSLWTIPFTGGKAKQITDPMLEPARPDYSPKGDLIAFQSYKGGTFHIWVMKPDGTALRQLTTGHGDDREPRFSADGKQIAFASDRAFKGSYDIWSINLATAKLTQWTTAPDDEYEPAWSPDSSEIAFVSGVGINGTTIQAVNASGKTRVVATAPTGARFNSPTWSPDGKRVAYVQFAGTKSILMVDGKPAGSDNDVFPFPPSWIEGGRLLYAANGKIHLTVVADNTTAEIPFEAEFKLNRPAYTRKKHDFDATAATPVKGIVSPTLSPDGRRVVFEALNQLWLMEIGGKPKPLTDDKFYKEDPVWSPDGKRIAYSSDKAGTEDLYVMDVDTKAETRVTSSAHSAEVSAAWSPDGKALAYQDENGATYTVSVDGGTPKKVIDAQFAPSKPSWFPGGKTIAICALKPYTRRFREGTSQILTVNLDTGALTYTEPAPFKSLSTRGEDGPLYSPDGKSLAFVMDSLLWIRPVDANGVPVGPARQVNHEVTDAPTWSGDSKHLLYLSNGKLRMIGTAGTLPRTIPVDLTWKREEVGPVTIIHAGKFWDGRGADEQSNVDIIVENGRVRNIEPHRERTTPGSTRMVDAANMTVMPGLWESHTHEWISGKFYGDRLGRLWMAYGVTELQSQGDPVYRAVETREAFGSGTRLGPRFFASGEAIDGERVYYNFMRPTMSDTQLDLELSRALALDYDLVKTYVRLPHEMQKKAMTFAHQKLGVVSTSHYMMPGMAYGMDGMSHVSATARLGFAYTRSSGGVSYEDMRTLFAQSGMFDISTAFASSPLYAEDPAMVDDPRLMALNTPWDEVVLRAKLAMAQGKKPVVPEGAHLPPRMGDTATTLDGLKKEMETVGAVVRAGGIMLAGTDSPLDNVATALHLGLRAQVKYGLLPWQALQTATLFPARAFGVEKDLGTLEVGKLADLSIVSGDPLVDIRAAANVQYVMKDGRLYSVKELMAPFAR